MFLCTPSPFSFHLQLLKYTLVYSEYKEKSLLNLDLRLFNIIILASADKHFTMCQALLYLHASTKCCDGKYYYHSHLEE